MVLNIIRYDRGIGIVAPSCFFVNCNNRGSTSPSNPTTPPLLLVLSLMARDWSLHMSMCSCPFTCQQRRQQQTGSLPFSDISCTTYSGLSLV